MRMLPSCLRAGAMGEAQSEYLTFSEASLASAAPALPQISTYMVEFREDPLPEPRAGKFFTSLLLFLFVFTHVLAPVLYN